MKRRAGDPIPTFSGTLSDGSVFRSSDLGGRPLVLYFYPKDFTTGCTRQACQFRDAFLELTGLGAQILGVSKDSAQTHERFRAEYRLPFPLLTDPDASIARLFGVTYLGGLTSFFKRVTFVIDSQGVIRGIFRHEAAIDRHVRDVRECLRAIRGVPA
jgi:peroxiredoxin Q/BCP